MKLKHLIFGLTLFSVVSCSSVSVIPQGYTEQGKIVQTKDFLDPVEDAVENDDFIKNRCVKIEKIKTLPLLTNAPGGYGSQILINLKNKTAELGGNFVALEKYRPHPVVKHENAYTGTGISYKCNR